MRINSQQQAATWGGIRVQALDYGWSDLGNVILTPATSPIGQWTRVQFSFVAVGTESRLHAGPFTDGLYTVSLDDFIVSASPIAAAPGSGKVLAKPVNAPQQQATFCTGKGYKAGCTITSYYTFAGQRVAMRVQSDANPTGVVTWLHGDHLGSASVATDANGNKIANSDSRYLPFGEARSGFAGTGLPTDRRFTGQISVAGGLIDMNARALDPLLGRFISADTIVPNPADPQSLNRFAYTRNNPLKYVDPSGHFWKEAFAILGGTVMGGAIGLGGETASQIISEGLSVVSGQKSVNAAVADFNSVENQASRIGATAGGATMGLIIGTASVRGKSVGVGTVAIASIMGGQVEALSGGLAEEKLMSGDGFDVSNAGVRAAKRGLLDPFTIAKDGGLGVAAGVLGDVVGKHIDSKAAKAFRPEIRQISDFDPITGRPNYISLGKSNVGRLNFAQQVFVNLLKTGWDLFSETTQRRISDKDR